MTTVGFELEMSDCLTYQAAQIVYQDLSLWEDRYGTYGKPKLDYSRWNLQSDGSIRNSDGTRCMTTYRDPNGVKKIANASKTSPDRLLWKGAELISPILIVGEDNWHSQFEEYISQFKEIGAVFSKSLYDSLHVHVAPQSSEYDYVMTWVQNIYECQTYLEELGNDWRKRRHFTAEEIPVLLKAAKESKESFLDQILRNKSGFSKPIDHDDVRRIVDLTHCISGGLPTVEFRCFSPIPTVEYIEACLELSTWLVDQWTLQIPFYDYSLSLQSRVYKIKELDRLYYSQD